MAEVLLLLLLLIVIPELLGMMPARRFQSQGHRHRHPVAEDLANDADSWWLRKHLHYNKRKDYRRLKKLEGAVKLVGGERGAFEGNVEVLHKGRWGNVCDDEWDELEAKVICRQLGYPATLARPTKSSHFGQPRRRYWMDNLMCDGREAELSHCRFDGWGKTDCDNSEAAGVICALDGDDEDYEFRSRNWRGQNKKGKKSRIKDRHWRSPVKVRLTGSRVHGQGQLEIKLGKSDWGTVCGDGWSLLEAGVVCRQLGLGYAARVYQTRVYQDVLKHPVQISGIECRGNEARIEDCLHDDHFDCPGLRSDVVNVAGLSCISRIADLVLDHRELERTAHLVERPLGRLQCAMEENCVASEAYRIQKSAADWFWRTRKLLVFTAKILNNGNADFRPFVPKHLWEWHMCHRHYHSMEVFATFDLIDHYGRKVAEGHKASFCLEDNQCLPGVQPRYRCAGYGDQGISVNCSDIYSHEIDCQWIDLTELQPGSYTFEVAVNPELKVGEMSFENNAARCRLELGQGHARVHSCRPARP